MKIYKVGGAVRDKILGKVPNDTDFVVIGSNIEQMKALGFLQVGKGFPVFLHPETKQEYALARKEIKTGDKHTDFDFVFTPDITLKEDLERRDFTCNAIAYDEQANEYIDYFGGIEDIKKRTIRHVNATHFVEDPLRVLRMCRFAAQLDFDVCTQTLDLCSDMVKKDMLKHITKERIWAEIVKAMQSESFYRFVLLARKIGALKHILPEVDSMFLTPERTEFHPEGNTGDHVINALKTVGAESSLIKFAVLLHDIGKILTPKEELPSHKGHEARGEELINKICKQLKAPNLYKNFAMVTSVQHMKYYYIPDMRAGSLYELVSSLLCNHQDYVEDFIAVCRADFESTEKENKIEEKKRFEYSAKLLCYARDVIKNIKAQDMPNFEILPKDENFCAHFKEYKKNLLSQKIKEYKKQNPCGCKGSTE